MSSTRDARRTTARAGLAALSLIGAALLAGPVIAGPAQAQTPSLPSGGFLSSFLPKAGHQRYVVQYREASDVAVQAPLLRASGADVLGTFTRLAPTMAVSMTPTAAQALAADPRVLSIEPDARVFTAATQTPAPWGLDRIDQRSLPLSGSYSYGSSGAGVTAYVIDTGLNLTHSDLAGRVGSGWDFVSNDSDPTDCAGHGTHVAGTIAGTNYGVAKAATIVPVRVLDCNGSGYLSSVIAGLDWVAANAKKPALANLSLGGGPSAALDAAIERLVASGVSAVVAAGNSNVDACGGSPGRTPGAITVGSTTSGDTRSSFSNYGTCVDVFAPGSAVTSSWIGSPTAYATISGTSMAAPHVAGAVAAFLSGNPTASPASVRAAVIDAATAGAVTSPGSGSPNLLLFSSSDGNTPTTTSTSTSTTVPAGASTTTSAPSTTIAIIGSTSTTKAATTTTKAATTTTKAATTTTKAATTTTKAGTSATTTTRATTTTKAGTSATTTTRATTTTVKPGLPSAPTNVMATPIVSGARITWTQGANGGSSLTRQTLRVYYVNPNGTMTYVGSATVGGSVTAVRLTGLLPLAHYRISVTAGNAIGNSPESAKSPVVIPTRS